MIFRPLIPHPATPVPAVQSLEVYLERSRDGVVARFACRVAPGLLRLPQSQSGVADELWRHTCCEVFVSKPGELAYREFNASPSGQWAMYGFSAYRVRDFSAAVGPKPQLSFDESAAGWTLELALEPIKGSIDVGVSVVLESINGALSYWALDHAGMQPDFHRRESFVWRLNDPADEK